MASIPGRTSKIRRYYWREIQFETFKRFADRAEAADLDTSAPWREETRELHDAISNEVLEEIKRQHEESPKYQYEEESSAEIIEKFGVEVVRLDATYGPKAAGKGAGILDGTDSVTAEEFAARHYQNLGWQTLFVESVPFHVLFGTYMWPLVQDVGDPENRIVSFGSRSDFDGAQVGVEIFTSLPQDFGTPGYAERRANAIGEHLDSGLQDDLEWLFDYSLEHSRNFREYLWAHRESDIERAREVVEVLPSEVMVRILRYLVGHYWGRYTGWPDLLVYNEDEFFFAEVKASKDKLSEDQKRWIRDNAVELHLPFKLVKIHRSATAA
jgi:VRR-NUC domain